MERIDPIDPKELIGRHWSPERSEHWYRRLEDIEIQDGLDIALQVEYRARSLLHAMPELKAIDSAREEVLYGGEERCRDCGGGLTGAGGGSTWCLVCHRVSFPPMTSSTSSS